ncbi:HAMP domain-containing protein [Acidovorax sp. 1608163]|uniref:methyl-accepting chemotaxis protein n=1 Tax=Acidovorax sp. 1608163 TaxID=2478662 RepID=UPI000EF74236|nr:methyl-accepting chemotaxis protein [Acidovorax sp. 1608163]AYM98852.1 HAMP domain-containing protein [Acidovorax sp. 1608163]
MSLSNLRVGLRLGLGFGLLLLLVLAMGLFAVHRVNRVHGTVVDLATNWLPSTQQLAGLNEALNQMRRAELQMILGGDAKTIQDESARIDKQWTLVPKLLEAYADTLSEGEEKQLFNVFKVTVDRYKETQSKLLALLRDAKTDEATAYLRGDSRVAFRATTDAIGKLSAVNDEGAREANVAGEQSYRTVLWGIWLMMAGMLATGAAVGWFLTRSLTVPLGFAAKTADRIADGDLTGELRSARGDELGDLLRALGRMQGALHASVSDVRRSADSISIASQEVSSGGQDLSVRTEAAAASIEQTSAALQQVTDTVRQSSASAQQAHQLASAASDVALAGGQVVARVIHTMDGIQTSSRKIGDIIGVIDSIAFQTNILALNAAVEAARAGEQGRGFAVVATEVRTLAQRSAQAAREIKQLIVSSVDEVEGGARLVGEAGQTMDKVVDSVQRVSHLIGEIASTIKEQSQSVGEVNTAISQLDGMTQQNAALVEQSAAASESLRDQAGRLIAVVARFRLQ